MNTPKEWPEIVTISSRDRYTKKHGGMIWKISTVDFVNDSINLVSITNEEHKEVEEWQGTGHEFIERFAKIE